MALVVQLPLDIFPFAFGNVAGVCRWPLRRRHLATSAQGQPQRCRGLKGLLIASSIGIQRAVRMNREQLWRVRASSALNLPSCGTNQVSGGFALFCRYLLFSFPSKWRTCVFVMTYERWSVIRSGGSFTIHYLKVLIWRVAYYIRRREVRGWFLDWWLAREFVPCPFFSRRAQLTSWGGGLHKLLLLNYCLYFQIISTSSAEIENSLKSVMF